MKLQFLYHGLTSGDENLSLDSTRLFHSFVTAVTARYKNSNE